MNKDKSIAILSPVAWRTPPRRYGAWETVASNITEGLIKNGWNVSLFATGDSITNTKLYSVIEHGYEVDKDQDAKVNECLHISNLMEHAHEFDLIHNNYDFLPLTYSRLINTPMLTTIHGFSSQKILPVYRKYKHDNYFVSISDSDRDPELPYLATVYNGIDLSQITYRQEPGENLVWFGRIHPDKGVHLAIQVAKKSNRNLILAGIIQDMNYFKTYIEPYIDDKKIKFVGPVDPVQRNELLKDAYTVLHLHTIPERFGLVMAEANAGGVPVIAMDLGSSREVIKDEKTGFLVNSIAEAVTALNKIDDIERKDCRRRVEENFTIEIMVKNYEKVYEKIFRKEEEKVNN